MNERVVRSSWNNPVFAAGILLAVWLLHAGVNLYLFQRVELPPFYDGANHFNISVEIADHLDEFSPSLVWIDELYEISHYYPPCYHVVTAVLMKVLGMSLDVARLPNLLFLALLMGGVFMIGKQLCDTRSGLLAAILVSFFPVVHGLTREIYVDLAVLAWAACAVALLLATDRFQRPVASFFFGLVCGLGLLTKWTFPVFIGGAVLWVFSECFVPFALSRIAIGFLGSEREEGEKIDPLPPLALFAAWAALLFGTKKCLLDPGVFLPWAVVSCAALLYVLYGLKTRKPSAPLSTLVERYRRPIPDRGTVLRGILISSVPALLIAGPWFLKHFAFIASEGGRVLTEAAEVRSMAEVGTLASALYYLVTLESHQLHLVFWLLALAALIGARGGKPTAFLIVTVAVSYLAMSALWVKDPRYFTPAIYPLPVLMAVWLLGRPDRTRGKWVVGTLAFGLACYGHQIASSPLVPAPLAVPTPAGQPLVLAGPPVYGNLLKHEGEWPHRPLIEAIRKDAAEHGLLPAGTGELKIPVIVDDGFLHAPALNCYASVLGAPLRFYNIAYQPDYRSDPSYTTRLLNVLRSPYFVSKEGGSLGLDFVTVAYEPLLDKLFSEDEGWGGGLEELLRASLPGPGTATLWKNDFSAAFLGDRERIDRRFTNGVRVESVRHSFDRGFRTGKAAVLQVEWTPEPKDRLDHLVSAANFFLHLVEADTGRFVQGWNLPMTTENLEVAKHQIERASPPAVVTLALLEPRSDLIPGVYRFELGAFNVTTNEKAPLLDPLEEIETTLAVGPSIRYEPEGWEWISAPFEDRDALAVRDEVGEVFLQSARVVPTAARPGDRVRFEAHWRVDWLELEAPEEQDIRAFAYLLPASPGEEAQPMCRTEWTLDALGHSGGEEPGFWSTEATIDLPSNLPDGDWNVHVGVRRPQYARDFVVKNGDQANRRSFVLDRPLHVGNPAWQEFSAEFPSGLSLEAARVLDATPAAGADLGWEVSWKAESATALVELASRAVLFAHLFSLEDGTHRQIESLPLFRRDRIQVPASRVGGRTGEAYYEAIRSGFVERSNLTLKETLPPGAYRLDFGVYLLDEAEKLVATLPEGTTATTLHLTGAIEVRTP